LGKVAMGRPDTMLVLDYQPKGRLSIAPSLPSFLRVEGIYNPEARIESGSPSPRAVRRYGSSGDLLSAPR